MSRSRITSLDRSDYEPLGLRKEKTWQGYGTPEFLEEYLDLPNQEIGKVVFTNDVSMFQMWQMRSIKGCIELLAAPRQAHKVSVMHRERLGPAGLKPFLYRSKKQVIHLTHYLNKSKFPE